MRNAAQRYVGGLLLVAALSLALIAGLNGIVDPYRVWATGPWPAINSVRPQQFKHAALFKAAAVMREQPTTIVLGSSRAEIGIDPEALGGGYNLSLPGGHLPSIRAYFDHAFANQPGLQRVVLGLDFFMFDRSLNAAPGFDSQRLGRTRLPWRDRAAALWSVDALSDSVDTLAVNLAPTSRENDYNARGMQTFAERRKRLSHTPLTQWFERSLGNYRKRFARFDYAPERFVELEHIIERCHSHGIELLLFISPTHALHLQAIKQAGLWPAFEAWKRELAARAMVWDFSGYNEVTTEPVSAQMQYYWDISHYRPIVGQRLLAQVLGGVAGPGLGVVLNPSNIERHLRQLRDRQMAWERTMPDWMSWFGLGKS